MELKKRYNTTPTNFWGIFEIDEYKLKNITNKNVYLKVWTEYKNGNFILNLTDKDKDKIMSMNYNIQLNNYDFEHDSTIDGYLNRYKIINRYSKKLSKDDKKEINRLIKELNSNELQCISKLEDEGILTLIDSNWIIDGTVILEEEE